jgi:hypothetical protein
VTTNRGEQIATRLLDHFGMRWEKIPEEDELRADYRVADGRCEYVIEVKQREGAAERQYEHALERDGHASMSQPMGYLNPVSALVTDAAAQLAATPATDDTLRVMMFVALGRDVDVHEEQLFSTVYGAIDLITSMKDGAAQATRCFYLGFSDFFRLPELDGVLTVLGDRCRLLVNAFSRRQDILRTSAIYQRLDAEQAVVDPHRLEAEKQAFIADCDISRHNRDAVLAYVKGKYRLPIAITFEPTHAKAGIVVSKVP